MHDDYIIGYSVNLKEKTVIIQTYNVSKRKQGEIYFSGVLTHYFRCILEYNQILDIHECEMGSFVNDNRDELMKMEGYCWPIDFQTEQELTSFLSINKYRYVKVDSSYGMFGWVLAKFYQLYE